jgi:prepilin-type N-terminal cleavage/methylation domain-containing protein
VQSLRNRDGFTIYELLIVIAIMGFIMALAVPSFTRYRRQESARSNAEVLAGAIKAARDRSIREGRQWFVLFNPPSGAIARVVQDMDNNFQETAGVDVVRDVFFEPGTGAEITPYGIMPAPPFQAAPRTNNDQQIGNLGTVLDGSGFPFNIVAGTTAMGFTTRGIPVDLQNPTAWGTGTGAYYITDNNATVYAIDVGPLGEVKVRGFSAALNQWN